MNTDFYTKNIEELNERELLQDLFDDSFLKTDEIGLRSHYKALRKIEMTSPLNLNLEVLDTSSLVENITLACDVICTDTRANFVYCGNDTSFINGNSKVITKSVLALLSNAFIYGRGNLITVKTIEKQNYVSIEIQNAGMLSQDFKFGDGLKYVNKVCKALNGHFFISTGLLSVKAVMLIPKAKNSSEIATTPHFCDFLSDRLSPVYVEFFGIE